MIKIKDYLICYIFFVFLLIIFLSACQKAPPIILPAFYHWQTHLELDDTESVYLKQLSTDRLYVKFFDVIWNQTKQEGIPTAVLQIDTKTKFDSIDIIPTIFITNQVFQKYPSDRLDQLSTNIWMKIQRVLPDEKFKEIQFDCDWTLSTRAAFFQFLSYFRTQIPSTVKLSATIRLHQYRYPEKTGIPPVDRGMLMFYNMGDLQEWDEPNSILNLEKAKPYLQKNDYPLPLDVALPLFKWGVLFRDGKMIKLINGLDQKRLADTSFFESLPIVDPILENTQYRLKKSTYLDGYYLYKNDLIRLEQVSPSNLKKAAKLLQSVIHTDTSWLSFYHLDTPVIEAYNYEIMEDCLDILGHPNQN